MAALGRPLRHEEAKFVQRIREVCWRCRQARQITHWDFEQMGLRLGGYGWDALRIWPSLPENEHEFWLYVANAAREHRTPIPDFMAPLTDLRLIQGRLARWRRSREIERWKQTLGNLRLPTAPLTPGSRGEFDLRVVVQKTEAVLHWKRPGQEAFDEIKSTAFRHLADDHRLGRVQFTPEAELLWQAFHQRFYFGRSLALHFHDPEACETLGRLARLRVLDSRLVDIEGQPLMRATEPLRWHLAPAASEEDDYRLRLAQEIGRASCRERV